ncbi:hypothetical protein Scep_013264 [Stephania cephalantha]|uniref:Uncharacterized protein n=1 Tax=Stephania cephalantha TaxID=152367 RepID=A0AAP0PAM1_9MAGN
MASISSLSFNSIRSASERKVSSPSGRSLGSCFEGFRFRTSFVSVGTSFSSCSSCSSSPMVVRCMSSGTGLENVVVFVEDVLKSLGSEANGTAVCNALESLSELVFNASCAIVMNLFVDVPTVAETKFNFLKAYRRPIPSVYNTVLQELIVQQHLMRYKKTYQYDAVFALGFVTVYNQLMDGYPSDDDRDAIFRAYIQALKEDPEQYRFSDLFPLEITYETIEKVCGKGDQSANYVKSQELQNSGMENEIFELLTSLRTDAQKLEDWARGQNANTLVDFPSRDGEVEAILKDIAGRAGGKGSFSYSRFFAVGLFRLLELANATEPTVLEKLCIALSIDKRSVDRDLDVYRNLLSKLVQAKELLKEYVAREKKKREDRADTLKANEAITKCIGEFQHAFQSSISHNANRTH